MCAKTQNFLKMLQFHKKYFLLTLMLFISEVLIALYMHDKFIRPYFGDVLVVILIYCFLKSFLNLPVYPTVLGVLIFSFFIEWTQHLNLITILGLQDSEIAKALLGNSFAWMDVACYTFGILIIILIEKVFFKNQKL